MILRYSRLKSLAEARFYHFSNRGRPRYSKGVSSPERFVRTRLYFTSESHIHSLLNMLRYGGLCDEIKDEQWMRAINYLNSVPELNYMTQIVIMMFEDPSKDLSSPERFHIELHFSPGAYTASDKDVIQFQGSGYRTKGKSTVASDTSQIPSELTTSKPSPKHREVVVAPAIAEELEEADIFESGRAARKDVQLNQVDLKELKTFTSSEESTGQKGNVNIPQPRSPDPDVPEWDWGDSTAEQTADKPSVVTPLSCGTRDLSQNEVTNQMEVVSDVKIPTAKSQPITIQMNSPSRERPKPVPTCGSYEEKRSRSLEDAEQKETALVERQYLTIQLPIKDRHRHSFSSLMFLNPNAFKDLSSVQTNLLLGSCSSPDLLNNLRRDAFEGFSMVPSLRPLETLHNALTWKDMDSFFSRATTTKFFTPIHSPLFGITPIVSPKPLGMMHKLDKVITSQPSSSNSSAGPSSPTTASNTVDILSKLRLYILDNQKLQAEEDQATEANNIPSSVEDKALVATNQETSPTLLPTSKTSAFTRPTSILASQIGSLTSIENKIDQCTSEVRDSLANLGAVSLSIVKDQSAVIPMAKIADTAVQDNEVTTNTQDNAATTKDSENET